MEGGENPTTIAPGRLKSGPASRPRTVWTECSAPGRSSNGFSRANISPWFGAAPLKLNPMTENSASTSGSDMMIFSACRATLAV